MAQRAGSRVLFSQLRQGLWALQAFWSQGGQVCRGPRERRGGGRERPGSGTQRKAGEGCQGLPHALHPTGPERTPHKTSGRIGFGK